MNAQAEGWWDKRRRHRTRKSVAKYSYKKGATYDNLQKLHDLLNESDISIRLHANGELSDGTQFLQITIEGINPKTEL